MIDSNLTNIDITFSMIQNRLAEVQEKTRAEINVILDNVNQPNWNSIDITQQSAAPDEFLPEALRLKWFTFLIRFQNLQGIDKVEIIKRLIDTYHIYIEDKVILKKTCWYLMKTFTDLTPTPQIEEDISEVRWFRKAELDEILENTYPSIKLLIDTYLKKKRKR